MVIWYQIVLQAAEEAYQRDVIDNGFKNESAPKEEWIKNRIEHWVRIREESNHGQKTISD